MLHMLHHAPHITDLAILLSFQADLQQLFQMIDTHGILAYLGNQQQPDHARTAATSN